MTVVAPKILLIGAGRVGLNLLRLFHRRGITVSIVVEPDTARHQRVHEIEMQGNDVHGINAYGINAREHDARTSVHEDIPTSIPEDISFVVLTVPDASVSETARRLAKMLPLPSKMLPLPSKMLPRPSGLTVFHCSGTMDSSALASLAEAGCVTGCIHPMQSFHSDNLEESALTGIGCGIEGGDEFWERGQALAVALDWRPLRIDARRKALYHAANVFAGNFPIVLASVAERLLAAATAVDGAAELSHLLPMMRTVLARLEHSSPAEALTGPAARGDHDTIARHLDALEETDPEIRILYEALTREASRLAGR